MHRMDSGSEGAEWIYLRIMTSGGPLRTLYENIGLHSIMIILDLLCGFGVARRTPV
jgi:hypothetical protein